MTAPTVEPCDIEKVVSALSKLAENKPSGVQAFAAHEPSKSFNACDLLDHDIRPSFKVPYRRPLALCSFQIEGQHDPNLAIACVKVPMPFAGSQDTPFGIEFILGIDLSFDQTWNLLSLGIADLSSSIALAPLERLTLEFQSSQRTVLEKSTVDSTEEIRSDENTVQDKEVMNAVRTSTHTDNWHVDGSAKVSIKEMAEIGINAGTSESTVDSSNTSIEHITDSTRKSSRTLKNLHKIEVRGVSEGVIQNRMTRIIKNPYRDRTLSLNVFQLLKRYSVETSLTEIRPALIIRINHLIFDDNFIIANSDFLRETLLDQALVDELPSAIKGVLPVFTGVEDEARVIAKNALHYLYDEINIFNVHKLGGGAGVDANSIKTCFDAIAGVVQVGPAPVDLSGIAEAGSNQAIVFFTTLGVGYKFYQDLKDPNSGIGTLDDNAIGLALAMKRYIDPRWDEYLKTQFGGQSGADNAADIMDQTNFNEIFRRMSGFLAIVTQMLEPLLPTVEDEQKAAFDKQESAFALGRLKAHLECHLNFYIQSFLLYISKKSNNQDIIDFVNKTIDSIVVPQNSKIPEYLRQLFDISLSFIDRNQIIVPAVRALEVKNNQVVFPVLIENPPIELDEIKPQVEKIDLPCDGIHLEVSEGICRLTDLPSTSLNSIDLNIKDASLKFNVPD